MKPIILLTAASIAAIASTSAFAEDNVSHRELRKDRAEVAKQEQQLRDAQAYGSAKDVRKQQKDVREARKELRQDRRDAYRAGVYTRPAGYRARAWTNGERLPASYYGQRYQVASSQYGLTQVYNGDRWVRVDRDVVRVSPNGTVREVRRNWFY